MAHAPFPSQVVQWVSVPEALNDIAPVLALCPTVVPLPLTQFLNPNDSIQHWLTSTLPLVLAPWVTEALDAPVSQTIAPVVTEAAPVVQKSRKSKTTDTKKETGKATDKTPRKRSPKTATATAQ